MTKMCTSDTSLMAMFAHDLLSFLSFLTSHPIHFAYLLFFSPYLFSLFSFLSPLLLSTLLSLLAVLSISPYHTNSSHLPDEFEFLGKTCSTAMNVLCTLPGPRQENVIGILKELDEMVLSPIVQALAGDEVTRLEFDGIMSELCNSSTIGTEIQNSDYDVLVLKGCTGEKMSLGEKMEDPVQSRNSKLYISSPLICELDTKGPKELIAQSNCEAKKGNNVNLESHAQIKSNMVNNRILSTDQIFLDEHSVTKEIDRNEEGKKAQLENYTSHSQAALVVTEMSDGGFDDYKSCASDMEGIESESDGNDPKHVNSVTSMQSDGNVGNGEDKLALNGMRNSLICNANQERLTKSISTKNWREHARTQSVGLHREGSLRVDKEWKRTLACKLYEERITTKLRDERTVPVPEKQRGGEEEEMDLIWEAIEVNSNKDDGYNTSTKSKGKKEVDREEETGDDEGEEDDGPVRQLCCLQALRVSTRKMNLGVGKSNLVKLSKVLKKMSVFHHVGRNSNKISEEKEIGVIKG